MTLFELALRNVRRNLENYTAYFVSLAFNIMVYYLFASLRFSHAARSAVGAEQELDVFFNVSSVVAACFAVVFVGYSTAAFLRRRRRELGLYGLVGMTRHEVGLLFFCETLLAGGAALVAGLLFGLALAKFFQLLLIAFLGFVGEVPFEVSWPAVGRTLLVFGVLFAAASAYGYLRYSRRALGQLLRAPQYEERELSLCPWRALLAPACLAAGYALLLLGVPECCFWPRAAVAAALLAAGTYACFRYLLPCLLRRFQRSDRYCRTVQLLAVSQLAVSLRRQVGLLTVVTVLGAVTLTAVGLGYHLYQEVLRVKDIQLPFSFAYLSDDASLDGRVRQVIDRYPQHLISQEVEVRFLLLPARADGVPGWEERQTVLAVSFSQFRQAAAAKRLPLFLRPLGADEALCLLFSKEPQAEQAKGGVVRPDQAAPVRLVASLPYPVLNDFQTGPTLVVADETYAAWSRWAPSLRGKAYVVDNPRESRELTRDVSQLVPAEACLRSAYGEFHEETKLLGLLLFFGFFVGAIVIFSSCSVLYFQQLNQVQAEGGRYRLLRQLGVSAAEARQALAAQLLPVFALPLLLAVVHSQVAFWLFGRLFHAPVLASSALSIGAYAAVYLGYYLLTLRSCAAALELE